MPTLPLSARHDTDPLLREKAFLAEQTADGKVPVYPGTQWAALYEDAKVDVRTHLTDLLSGKKNPDEVGAKLKPIALTYDVSDLQREGVEAVAARIRSMTAAITHYDHHRLARFVYSLRGKDVDPQLARELYDSMANARVQKQLLESYGSTGKRQLTRSLQSESARARSQFSDMHSFRRVFAALKMRWLHDEGVIEDASIVTECIDALHADERYLFDRFKDDFSSFVQGGDDSACGRMTEMMRSELPAIKKLVERGSDAMETLSQELDHVTQSVPEEELRTSAVPPDDRDEWRTHGGVEIPGAKRNVYYEVTAAGDSEHPMIGHYATGTKSVFDSVECVWRKEKSLSPYAANVDGKRRQRIAGVTDGSGLKAVPIPKGYAPDMRTLASAGALPQFFRDAHGQCYVGSPKPCRYEVEFAFDPSYPSAPPTAEDLKPLSTRDFAPETEAFLSSLSGDETVKVSAVHARLTSEHFYPSEKILELQHALRTGGSGDEYALRLEKSEYVECVSGNSLGVAYLRKAGVPARMVFGDLPQQAEYDKRVIDPGKEGWRGAISSLRGRLPVWLGGKSAKETQREISVAKVYITDQTGHAWAEYWDGDEWKRIDFTPGKKPRDTKPGNDEPKPERPAPSQRAHDPALEPPQRGGQGEEFEQSDSLEELMSDLAQATADQVAQGKAQSEQAVRDLQKMEQTVSELRQKLSDSESFKDLRDIESIVNNEALLPDMKEEIERKVGDKRDAMKKDLGEDLNAMDDDGFIDEATARKLREMLERNESLEKVQKELERDRKLYAAYDAVREEMLPLVDEWYAYFLERLPRTDDIVTDEDTHTMQGRLDRRAAMRPRNLIFGRVNNPRILKPEADPRFIAAVVLDVSGSMSGDKLTSALKMLVFYCELFARITKECGYVRFSIYTFSDSIREVKRYDHDYDSRERYDYADGESSTVKVRLMNAVRVEGGTNMLPALKRAATDLNDECANHPDFASALYFFGDGGDTSGNARNITAFLQNNSSEHGFGEHMVSAVLLGNKSEKRELSALFGEERTTVARDLDELIAESMYRFEKDIVFHLEQTGAIN